MLRGPSRRVSWTAVVGIAAGIGIAALGHAPSSEPAIEGALPVVTATSRPDARSCKPLAPLLVTLASTARPGVWRVHVEALAEVESAEVALGAMAAGQDIARRIAWTGRLSQGETRDLQVDFAPPPGASYVWAEGAAGAGPGALQRGRAAIALRDGRVTATPAPEPRGGRLTVDPQTGEKVVEFAGSREGGR